MTLQQKIEMLVDDVMYDHRRGVPYVTDVTADNEPVIEAAVDQGLLEAHYVEPRKIWGKKGRREVRLRPAMNPNPRRPTFNQAKGQFWEYLEERGWKMSSHSLKIPHATDPATGTRVWFKPQALYVGYHNNIKEARSLHTDIRDMHPLDYPNLEREVLRKAEFLRDRNRW